MEKEFIRHEPLLMYIYMFGIVCFGAIIIEPSDSLFLSFVIFVIIESILLLFHFILRKRIIAEITDEGINIIDEEFIRWNDIKSWDYTNSSNHSRNFIKIKTEKEEYVIRGFSRYKVLREFKKHIPES
jgi:hypothetical protein